MIDPTSLFRINNQFATIKQGEYKLSFRVPHDLPYFEGHFPEYPILPAIAVIDLSTEFIRTVIGRQKIEVAQITSGKFMDIITPEMQIRIELIQQAEKKWSATWFCEQNAGAEEKKMAELAIILA